MTEKAVDLFGESLCPVGLAGGLGDGFGIHTGEVGGDNIEPGHGPNRKGLRCPGTDATVTPR